MVESLDGGEQKGMNFVRIVAPDDVLKRYAEILNLRLPMKKVRMKVMSFIPLLTELHTYFLLS